MNYTNLKIGDKTYKLRLTTRHLIELEDLLGENPLIVLARCSDGSIPEVKTMVYVLYTSLLKYQPEITLDDTYDLFDKWLEEGNLLADFIFIIIDIFKDAGLINNTEDEKN